MNMDWEPLLDELWGYAESEPKVLDSKLRMCLKGHSPEALPQAISFLVSQGKHGAGRALLTEFLRDHQSATDIHRRLKLIVLFKENRVPRVSSIKSKRRIKELFIKDVNDLVASGNLLEAESLLLDAIKEFEDPDSLSLLGRVYLLQRRPVDGAKAQQRALFLRRQQQAFFDIEHEESVVDLPTDSDLAFINGSAEHLATLDPPIGPTGKAEEADDSLSFIQSTASHYPSLSTDDWWTGASEPTPPQHPIALDQSVVGDASDAEVTDIETSTGVPLADGGETEPSTRRKTLTLAFPRKEVEEVSVKIRVVNKVGRSVTTEQPFDLEATDPANLDEPISQPVIPVALDSTSSTAPSNDEESDDYQGEPASFISTAVEPNALASNQPDVEYDEPGDELDLDDDLEDASIFGLEVDQDEFDRVFDDFRDLEDDYAAYAFDPDEVFGSEEALANELDDSTGDRLSHEERALQKAAELIGKVNWPISALPLIQRIFIMSGWGATRIALEREIERGLTPQELVLAAHIKVIWAENDIYWISFDKTGSSRLSHYVLSWPSALLIVRSFEALPQVEEVEFFLENLFTDWYENSVLRRTFKAFARYLWFRFANLEGCLPANQPFDFCDPHGLPVEEYSDLGLCDTLEYEKNDILRAFGVFQTKHPQEPGCYYSDRPRAEDPPPPIADTPSEKQTNEVEALSTTPVDEGSADVAADALPQWSAEPLISALNANTVD
ncbi:hypothetical protein [Pseudomonas sp. URMO17WK12:I4]|uniref:hypothetical protein n=1 Tax=Pseudomonas sp. URMO17WK12:I4 TaxID=1283292 RepID=UPI0004828B40|nr:hypothetical protein [Pseudomonas sp. URMO17WK12:I4]